MRNFRKIFALALLVAVCAVGLASCANQGGEKVFVIGGTGPLTGENSDYGSAVYNGAMLAIQEINAAGGFGGYTFRLSMKQDNCDPAIAADAYLVLFEKEGMKVSIGSVTSGAAKGFADAAAEDRLFCLTPSASADNVIGAGAHSFRVCFGDPQQGSAATDELVREGFRKIGVVYEVGNQYSEGIFHAFEEKMAELGKSKDVDYVVTSFDSDNNKEFSTQIKTMAGAGCDVIFLPIYYGEAALIAKAAARTEFNVPILGCDGLDGIAGQLDDSVTANVRYITPFDVNSTDAKVAHFVEAYKAAYGGATPNQFAADGYDAIMIIYEAMKAGEIDPADAADVICTKLASVLTGGTFRYSGVTGSDMTWSKAGSCEKQATIVTVKR